MSDDLLGLRTGQYLNRLGFWNNRPRVWRRSDKVQLELVEA